MSRGLKPAPIAPASQGDRRVVAVAQPVCETTGLGPLKGAIAQGLSAASAPLALINGFYFLQR